MQVNWKEKSGRDVVTGAAEVAQLAQLGKGCLTVCCMVCLMICLMVESVSSASAAEPGKIKVNLDFTKINKALEDASNRSNSTSSGSSSYTVAPSPRMSSTTRGSASATEPSKIKVNLDFTKINKALGEESTPTSNRSTTRSTPSNTMGGMTGMTGMAGMADTMSGSIASSIVGSMAPAMTGGTSRTSKSTSGNKPSNLMEGLQMDSEMTKIINETRSEMMKSIMQGMFSNPSMMANMQKKVMSGSMPKSSSQGGSSPSVLGSMNSSGK